MIDHRDSAILLYETLIFLVHVTTSTVMPPSVIPLDRKGLGYGLAVTGASLIVVAWFRSYPVSIENPGNYLFNSISPLYWIGLSLFNGSLLLIASNTRSRFERYCCGLAFFAFAFSIRFFFVHITGPDSDYFRGLGENFMANRTLEPRQHEYYQWPSLFTLSAIVSEVLHLDINAISFVLFLTWTVCFTGLLFFFQKPADDVRDFLSIAAYVIVPYAFLNWQFAAQTFGLVLFFLCVQLMTRRQIAYLSSSIVVYVALVLTHGFLALFLVIGTLILTVWSRRYFLSFVSFALLYGLYVVFRADILFLGLLRSLVSLQFLREYLLTLSYTLAEPVPGLDALGQLVSRAITVSLGGILAVLTLRSIMSRKIRGLDLSLILTGLVDLAAGLVVPFIGPRAFQIVMVPMSNMLKTSRLKHLRQPALAYFFLLLVLFPFSLIHLYYTDTHYMTLREQTAADVIIIPLYNADSKTDAGTLVRALVEYYLLSKSTTGVQFFDETRGRQIFADVDRSRLVFMSPELEVTLANRLALSESEIARLRSVGVGSGFSRIYSDGHVKLLLSTTPP